MVRMRLRLPVVAERFPQWRHSNALTIGQTNHLQQISTCHVIANSFVIYAQDLRSTPKVTAIPTSSTMTSNPLVDPEAAAGNVPKNASREDGVRKITAVKQGLGTTYHSKLTESLVGGATP